MKIFKTGFKEWENRHEIFVQKISDLYQLGNDNALEALEGYNDTTKGFQKLIGEAIENNMPLRALGSGWSWTKIATVEAGVMLDTKPLNTIFSISNQSVVPEYKGDINKLFLAQCGNGIGSWVNFYERKIFP